MKVLRILTFDNKVMNKIVGKINFFGTKNHTIYNSYYKF